MLKERLEIEKGGKVDGRKAVDIFPVKIWLKYRKMSTSKHSIYKVYGRREGQSGDICEEAYPKAFFPS